jgi:hypothetical protein
MRGECERKHLPARLSLYNGNPVHVRIISTERMSDIVVRIDPVVALCLERMSVHEGLSVQCRSIHIGRTIARQRRESLFGGEGRERRKIGRSGGAKSDRVVERGTFAPRFLAILFRKAFLTFCPLRKTSASAVYFVDPALCGLGLKAEET